MQMMPVQRRHPEKQYIAKRCGEEAFGSRWEKKHSEAGAGKKHDVRTPQAARVTSRAHAAGMSALAPSWIAPMVILAREYYPVDLGRTEWRHRCRIIPGLNVSSSYAPN